MISLLHFTRRLLLYSLEQKKKLYFWNWRLLETLFCYTEFLHLVVYKTQAPKYFTAWSLGNKSEGKLFEDELLFEESSLVC